MYDTRNDAADARPCVGGRGASGGPDIGAGEAAADVGDGEKEMRDRREREEPAAPRLLSSRRRPSRAERVGGARPGNENVVVRPPRTIVFNWVSPGANESPGVGTTLFQRYGHNKNCSGLTPDESEGSSFFEQRK